MSTSNAASTERFASAPRAALTLLDLVNALGESGATDREVVAAVVDLLASGRVRLVDEDVLASLLAH